MVNTKQQLSLAIDFSPIVISERTFEELRSQKLGLGSSRLYGKTSQPR